MELLSASPLPPEPVVRGPVEVAWLAADLKSGQIAAELPGLYANGTIARSIGAYTSCDFSLPLASTSRGWEAATQPGRTMLVAVAGDLPVWGGMVLVRKGGTDPNVSLGCATCEAYLDRRYVGDHTWRQADEAAVIAAGLFADANTEGIGLTIDAPATGVLRDKTYEANADKTVYSALTDLMGIIDGPEWTIDLAWADGQTRVEKIARVRKRIGVAA